MGCTGTRRIPDGREVAEPRARDFVGKGGKGRTVLTSGDELAMVHALHGLVGKNSARALFPALGLENLEEALVPGCA